MRSKSFGTPRFFALNQLKCTLRVIRIPLEPDAVVEISLPLIAIDAVPMDKVLMESCPNARTIIVFLVVKIARSYLECEMRSNLNSMKKVGISDRNLPTTGF